MGHIPTNPSTGPAPGGGAAQYKLIPFNPIPFFLAVAGLAIATNLLVLVIFTLKNGFDLDVVGHIKCWLLSRLDERRTRKAREGGGGQNRGREDLPRFVAGRRQRSGSASRPASRSGSTHASYEMDEVGVQASSGSVENRRLIVDDTVVWWSASTSTNTKTTTTTPMTTPITKDPSDEAHYYDWGPGGAAMRC